MRKARIGVVNVPEFQVSEMEDMVPTTQPKPVIVSQVCSMCGLDWERHGEKPTTEDCIRLLKAELASRPVTITIPSVYPYPVVPGAAPYPWWYTIWNGNSNTLNDGHSVICTNTTSSVLAPALASSTPEPVAA